MKINKEEMQQEKQKEEAPIIYANTEEMKPLEFKEGKHE